MGTVKSAWIASLLFSERSGAETEARLSESEESGFLADPQGMLRAEQGLVRQLVSEHFLKHKWRHDRALQALTTDDVWAARFSLEQTLAAAVAEKGSGSATSLRDVASLRALEDVTLLELITLIVDIQDANATSRSRASYDLQWLLRLLPRNDRSALAAGHLVLSWVMLNSVRADSDGYVRLESMSSITQAWWLSRQASFATVRQICEVGFNGGHSAWAMLSGASPTAQMVSFDLISKSYTQACHRVLRSTFPRRHRLVDGSSNVSIPQFISQNLAHRCDLIFVDGGHTEADAISDLLHMSLLATSQALVVMDDVGCASSFCWGPTRAWQSFTSAGRILEMGCREELERRWCWGRYV